MSTGNNPPSAQSGKNTMELTKKPSKVQTTSRTKTLVTNNRDVEQEIASKKRLLATMILGALLLVIPIVLIYVDPVLIAVQYKLRLENSSMLHKVLQRRITSTKLYMYLFHVTNAQRFLSGADHKLKLKEVGPFVYQEYRTLEDLEINKDPGVMRYTPKLETVFVPEESIGDPKEINITVPDIAMLAATGLISKYPLMVRQFHNMMTAIHNVNAFLELRAHDHMWGYSHPLIDIANNLVPGLIYFKSVGLLERMYDVDVDFRLELGTTNAERFSVKKVTKIQARSKQTDAKALIDNTFCYNDTYEGAAFPTRVTQETPINIYRLGLCKTFQLQYAGTTQMPYGGDGFLYQLHNDTYRNKKLCNTQGWCPDGLKDMSDCYFGFPLVLSKSHFLDSDPQLLNMVEGLKPDRKLHTTQVILDPKIGVGISGSMALQMNLFLTDLGYNPQTQRLKDTVLPVCNIIAKAPPLIYEVSTVLQLMYRDGPYLRIAAQAICVLLGLFLLTYSPINTYCRKESDSKVLTRAGWPLLTE